MSPLDPANRAGADQEPSIGETATRLVEEGKAYARAELELARARLDVKMVRIKAVAILGGVALLFAIGALIALAVTAVLALASLLGPLGGGLAATALIGGLAAVFAFLAVKRWGKGDE